MFEEMATLESMKEPDHSLVMAKSEIIGRSASSTIIVPDRRVSSVHTCVEWQSSGWIVRDLGSRNGTFVDATRLRPGEDVPLVSGAVLRVADAASWRLVDDGPPTAMAVPIVSDAKPLRAGPLNGAVLRGDPLLAEAGLLAIPSDSDVPEVTIFRTTTGTWLAEYIDEQFQIVDGDTVYINGTNYRVHLPGAIATTVSSEQASTSAIALRWHFAVSRDEEHASLTVCSPKQTWEIPSRAWLYTVLTLARQRVRDQRATDLPIAAHGWIHQDKLATMLGHTVNHLHTDIYRARRALSKHGIENVATMVERRPGSKLLRFGYQHIFVRTV